MISMLFMSGIFWFWNKMLICVLIIVVVYLHDAPEAFWFPSSDRWPVCMFPKHTPFTQSGSWEEKGTKKLWRFHMCCVLVYCIKGCVLNKVRVSKTVRESDISTYLCTRIQRHLWSCTNQLCPFVFSVWVVMATDVWNPESQHSFLNKLVRQVWLRTHLFHSCQCIVQHHSHERKTFHYTRVPISTHFTL